ncbi:MAG: NTP transferase domain-containing protein [Chitinivibrionales bacterium]|nr:NTP transferase domain-containing protein [Chitinivibrionales bacterium]MBD3357101.1 NTP transferase domain-containing protein [Chitinivibrionales bacterium]
MKIVPVLLAGGIGERFWPLSRSSTPKQLLSIISRKTMLEETIARTSALSDETTKPLIVTAKAIVPKIRRALPRSIRYNTIAEPVGKNTAPAIAAAAAWVRDRYDDALMLVLSADHAIKPVRNFTASVRFAAELAERHDSLVVFGITPTHPETGYGYIHLGKRLESRGEIQAFAARRFVEKPSPVKAERYVVSGKYLWNSGMFVWKASVIQEELRTYMPELYHQAQTLAKGAFSAKAIESFYHESTKQSIDYGVMERSQRVQVVCGTFNWDDIGSWEAMRRQHPTTKSGTAVVGKRVYEEDCRDSIIVNKSKQHVAALGLENAVVVTTDDAVLVTSRNRLPELKKYLGTMKGAHVMPARLF